MKSEHIKADIAPMNLSQLQQYIHKTAKEHGWWDGKRTVDGVGMKLALVHSEVSEALEELRIYGHDLDSPALREPRFSTGGKPDGFGVELADAVIRIMDLCSAMNIDLETLIKLKMSYNETRSHRHGGKAA